MANNGPISVSAPGTSLSTAVGTDITFNTRYPFSKLDSTNPVSFRLITLFLAADTPTPDGTIITSNEILVGSLPHGYPYAPSSWFLTSLDNFQTVVGTEGITIDPGGAASPDISATSVLVITVDDQNINFYIYKTYYDLTGGAPDVLGYFITIRSYIFVNDLSGTDVPTSP